MNFLAILLASILLGQSMNAFAFLGFGANHWKEEVLQHDGSKIVVERTESYGGRREIGQSAPIREQEITFAIAPSKRKVSFKSEYSEDIGRANFILLALHLLNGTPYIVAKPNLCLSYNKWGRPNPNYVIFKYDGTSWNRIALQDLPSEFSEINLVVNTKRDMKKITTQSVFSAELVKKLNSTLSQPEFKSIQREPLPDRENYCPKLVRVPGGWDSPGGAKAPVPIHPRNSIQK